MNDTSTSSGLLAEWEKAKEDRRQGLAWTEWTYPSIEQRIKILEDDRIQMMWFLDKTLKLLAATQPASGGARREEPSP